MIACCLFSYFEKTQRIKSTEKTLLGWQGVGTAEWWETVCIVVSMQDEHSPSNGHMVLEDKFDVSLKFNIKF